MTTMEHYRGMELKGLDGNIYSSSITDVFKGSGDDLPPAETSSFTNDQRDMRRLGKKQQFRV